MMLSLSPLLALSLSLSLSLPLVEGFLVEEKEVLLSYHRREPAVGQAARAVLFAGGSDYYSWSGKPFVG
jgi:hypothetical protein